MNFLPIQLVGSGGCMQSEYPTTYRAESAPLVDPNIDTRIWTAPTATPRRQPPDWFSWPVAISAIPAILYLVYLLVTRPISLAGFIPLFIVGPYLLWLSNLKPANRPYWMHAFLWGTTVSVVVPILVQQVVHEIYPMDASLLTLWDDFIPIAIVAPIFEELVKGAGIIYIARSYKKVDNRIDGIVLAGFIALGFTVFEDVIYIAQASSGEETFLTIVGRTLITPFAHMLMTVWIGYAVGRCIERRESLWGSAWGFMIAITIHALWNGSIVLDEYLIATNQESVASTAIRVVVVFGFFALFCTTLVTLALRRAEKQTKFDRQLHWLTSYYAVQTAPVNVFFSWDAIKATRKAQSPELRKRFDQATTSLVRLGQLHEHYQQHGRYLHPAKETEQEIVATLNKALGRQHVPIAEVIPATTPPMQPNPAALPYELPSTYS